MENDRSTWRWRVGLLVALTWCAWATPGEAQDFRGRVAGVVKDASDAPLPGVTITATSPALIQPQTTTSAEDGTYRLIALPPGVYEITFELSGFRTLKRADVRVVINTTLTLNVGLEVATLQETVTVSGASPIVDTTSTAVGTNFTKELLTEIPNARDVWAAMAQAPGFQMTGFDVGGSHTGTQTGYGAFGVMQQHTTKVEGINSTEGTEANGGYFDFGSFEEFQLGGSGNGAEQDAPGASLNISVKSGGDRFSGTWYSDWEGRKTISDNVPEAFKTNGGRDENGFFVRTALTRGNPIDRQYDINPDIGGPILRQKAWFYYSYRLNDQYKYVLNFDELARSKLSNKYTAKGTYQLSRNNQLIGYSNMREKLQALRDLGSTIPISAAYFQGSKQYIHKGEWTSVLNDRLFLDVIVGTWINMFPLRPTTESGAFSGDYVPARLQISNSERLAGGPNIAYQDQRRHKPQFNASLSYFKDGWLGGHNLKFGTESRWEERAFFADQPFNLVYYDTVLNQTPSEVEFYNTPNDGINNTNAFSLYASDTWRLSDKVTLNLGLRFDRYRDFWPDQTVDPGGVPELAGTTDPRLIALFSPLEVAGKTVSESSTFGPRIGLAYDLRGNGRSVFKAYFGRFYFNSAPDTIAAAANPVGRTRLRYRWTDLNGNLKIDGPNEVGAFLRTAAGPSGVTIDPNLERPFGDEYSLHYEQELIPGLSGRASYVHKSLRNEWETVDLGRVDSYVTPITRVDPGPDNTAGTADDRTLELLDRVAANENRIFTDVDEYDTDYDTIEFALNRRMKDKWLLMTSVGYSWAKAFYGQASSTSATSSGGNEKAYDWRPNFTRFGRETTTSWNYKVIGRYEFPLGIASSASYKLQSGRQWGRSIAVTLPVAGSETVRAEPVTANRAPNVGIFDLRFDKSFRFGRTKLTGMVDIFNLANAGTVTGWTSATGTTFKEAVVLLDPRIVRFGLRVGF
jgi:outer membrane receptor protein involved in Fe transport